MLKFIRGDERRFLTAEEHAAGRPDVEAAIRRMPPEELLGSSCLHYPGSSTEPQLFERRLPPETTIEPHAHEVDEIMVVVEGQARFGNQVYGVGSSVFIPKMTLYSFSSGPEGLTFLNFRPTN